MSVQHGTRAKYVPSSGGADLSGPDTARTGRARLAHPSGRRYTSIPTKYPV